MIEVALNRSLEAIRTRAKKLGIKRDPKTKYLSTTRFKDLAIGEKRAPPKRKKHFPSSGEGVLLVNIGTRQCHFPIDGQLYCGAECDKAYGYCKTHHMEMWNK